MEVAVLAVAVMLAAAGFALVLPKLARGPVQPDFDAYYSAARMLNAHLPLYGAIPDSIMGPGSPPAPHREYVYPPLFAGVLRPLARLPYRTASLLWLVCNVATLGVLVQLTRRLSATARRHSWRTLAALVALPAVYITWFEGQVSLLIAALMLVAVAETTQQRTAASLRSDLLAGAALGLAGAIKVYPVLLIPVFIWHRRWRVVASAIAVGALATGLGAMLSGGTEATMDWVHRVLPAVAERSWPGNQSLSAVVERLGPTKQFMVWTGSSEREVNLRVLLSDRQTATMISRVAQVLLVLISGLAILRRGALASRRALGPDLALATLLMSLVAPVVWEHYYVQLIIPFVLLLESAQHVRMSRYALLISALLIVLQRYWRLLLFVDESGWVLMFGFLGVMAMWVAMLRICADRSLSEADPEPVPA